MSKPSPHIPVLLDEVITHLDIQANDIVLEGTCGFGGHSEKILETLSPKGLYIGIDQDLDALTYCQEKFKAHKNATFFHQNFSNFDTLFTKEKLPPFTKCLLDLGVSSHQLDQADRGFSHRYSAQLDMRMNQKSTLTAASILNTYSEKALSDMFFQYGELRHNKKLVDAICHTRKTTPITTTDDLKTLIKKSYYFRNSRSIYMRTCSQVFQALRIECNQELEHLNTLLQKLEQHSQKNSLTAIITFHSLEDKCIKTFVKESKTLELTQKSVIKPSKQERTKNPRSRSAKCRVIRSLVT